MSDGARTAPGRAAPALEPFAGDVCVFAKPPVAGQVKTRLARTLGQDVAAELAAAFFADTWALLRTLPWIRPVLATTQAGRPEGLACEADAEVWLQGEGGLGERLERVLRRALERGPWAMALGADTPGLPGPLLEEARAKLAAGADAVLGPAEDGGFYLLALKRCPPGLLAEGLPWSSADTLERTRERLESHGLRTVLLEPWFDVDTEADLHRLADLLAKGAVRAPSTHDVLIRLGLVPTEASGAEEA
ncbi:TIGR04282 family arsenosugar biosynthesis glycosyltransferase [Pyxidicoccus sp. 3LFB2]